MKALILTLNFILAFTFAQSALAQQSCIEVFSTQSTKAAPEYKKVMLFPKKSTLWGIKLKREPLAKLLDSKDKKDVRKVLALLMSGMADTVFSNISEKLTLEKGTLKLAKILENGDSLELGYASDMRGANNISDQVFQLKQVNYIKKNSQQLVLTKVPLADNGRDFFEGELLLTKTPNKGEDNFTIENVSNKKLKNKLEFLITEKILPAESWYATKEERFSMVEVINESIYTKMDRLKPYVIAENKKAIEKIEEKILEPEVLPTIQGKVIDKLVVWTPLMEFLTRKELRNFPEDPVGIRKLFVKAKLRSYWDTFRDKIIRKQSLKYGIGGSLILGVLYAYNAFTNHPVENPITSKSIAAQIESSKKSIESTQLESFFMTVAGNWTRNFEESFFKANDQLERQMKFEFIFAKGVQNKKIDELYSNEMTTQTTVRKPLVRYVDFDNAMGALNLTGPIKVTSVDKIYSGFKNIRSIHFYNTQTIMIIMPIEGQLNYFTYLVEKSSMPELYTEMKTQLGF